jgi:hypothetical protein
MQRAVVRSRSSELTRLVAKNVPEKFIPFSIWHKNLYQQAIHLIAMKKSEKRERRRNAINLKIFFIMEAKIKKSDHST